jgi:hypothetical protein
MDNELPQISEDDEYFYVPEELFKHLPPEYQESVEAQRKHGSDVLRIVDKDIENLIRLLKAIPTTNILTYTYHRLRMAKFEATTEAFLEQEMLTTAFIVTYARLFVEGNGGSGVARDQIPSHLRSVHDGIMELRHERYAHNGRHETVGSGASFLFLDNEIRINLEMNSGLYIGGRNEWDELVTFLNEYMYKRLQKILARLKKKTGYEWRVPVGPAPDWTDNSN